MNHSANCLHYGHDRFRTLLASIRSDIRRFQTKSAENLAAPDDLLHRGSAFFTPEILAQTLYRLSHFAYVNGWRRSAILLSRLNSYVHKINIPPQSCIGPGLHIPHPCAITFCGCAGEHLTLYSLATCGATYEYADPPLSACPVLGDRIISGAHQAILGPVVVGNDVILGVGVSKIEEHIASTVLVYPRQARVFVSKPRAIEDFLRPSGGNSI
mgnify:CR=1 FL=1